MSHAHTKTFIAQTSGDLRLVQNGSPSSSYTSGRLEVYYGGQWRTMCYNRWSLTNTIVACRQLGLTGGITLIGYDTSSAVG